MAAGICKEAAFSQAGLRRVALLSSAAGAVLLLTLTRPRPSVSGYHDPRGVHAERLPIRTALGGSHAGPSNQSDPDTDDDGVYDVDEEACGGDALNPSIRPERLDGPFDNISDDGDVLIDELLPLGSEEYDCDGDGWKGRDENLIFSASLRRHDQDPCGNSGWSADSDPDNRLNIGDFGRFFYPFRPVDDGHGSYHMFNHLLDDDGDTTIETNEDPGYNVARFNLDLPPHEPDTAINIGDLNALNPGVLSPTARPPMFGGQPAFLTDLGPGPMETGQCRWPP